MRRMRNNTGESGPKTGLAAEQHLRACGAHGLDTSAVCEERLGCLGQSMLSLLFGQIPQHGFTRRKAKYSWSSNHRGRSGEGSGALEQMRAPAELRRLC